MSARVLIVEDETIVAMDLAATLRRLGYEIVGTVGTGAAAIEAARAQDPDLVLMDIRLKGQMDGIAAATAIRQAQGTPVVFLTAHADVDTVERSKEAAPYGYLVKPFDERLLHRVVEIALHRAVIDRAGREQTLDALWQSEERFRLLVEAVQDYGLFMIDRAGRIVSWNPGAERMSGFSENDVLGQPVTMLRAPDADAEDAATMFARIRRDGYSEWDDAGIRKDGSRYVRHVYCAPMVDRRTELLGYVSVVRDVTLQRSLESQLLQAQRLESLGQLAGGVAHDFNNMLMVIFSRCDLLLRSLESEKHRQYVNDVRLAALKNRDLTQQLLAASRQQMLQPHVVNLNDVVGTAMQLLGPTLGEHIRIEQHLERSPWSVHADPGKLHQVLLNLAINARDAMENGGVLTVETRNVHVDSSYARQHLGLREGDYVALLVSDTGTGIPAAIRDRVYDPFFTTKEPGRGTGLGLAVVRGIVEQTGGLIWMYSEEGQGTAFKIFLPRHTVHQSAEKPAEEAAPQRGGETILLVEDEDLLRNVVRESMEEHGYQVLEARTAVDALTISRAFGGPLDLLVSDVIMPGMSGTELAERIAAERPGVKIILMSGYTQHAVRNHAKLPDGVRYLEKPITTTLLLQTIRTVLDG